MGRDYNAMLMQKSSLHADQLGHSLVLGMFLAKQMCDSTDTRKP